MTEQHRSTLRRAYSARTHEPRIVYCRGCGEPFHAGREAREHRPNCIPCLGCGHSVAMRVDGCACCEAAVGVVS